MLASFGILCTLTKKEVIRNKSKSDLDYPFALPKYIFTALNKCCPWSSTSRFCSFLWAFGKNRAKAHHPRDSYLSVLIFVSFWFFYFLSLRKDVIIAKVFTRKSSSWKESCKTCVSDRILFSTEYTENPRVSQNTFPSICSMGHVPCSLESNKQLYFEVLLHNTTKLKCIPSFSRLSVSWFSQKGSIFVTIIVYYKKSERWRYLIPDAQQKICLALPSNPFWVPLPAGCMALWYLLPR